MVRKTSSKPLVTYHVVREPDRPPTSQASFDSRLVVEKAKPPRAAEARSARPANPVRNVEGRVSILSVRSFARLAACLVGVFHGVCAEARVGPTSTAFPATNLNEPPGGLDDAVRLLGEMGVELFYVAQGNEADQASLSSMNAVLHGLIGDFGTATLLQQGVEKAGSSAPGANRQAFDKAISKNAKQIGDDPHGRFADLAKTRRVVARPVSNDARAPSYLGDVIESAPVPTVVGLSKEFAFYLPAGPNTLRFPGRSATMPVPKQYELAEPQLANQNATYALFQASSDVRPSALIVTTKTVAPAEAEELWDYFKGQFAVSMVPLEDGVQAMIVAPLAARSELMGLLEELTDRGVGPNRPPPAATLDQLIRENRFLGDPVIAIPGTLASMAAAIAGAWVVVYKCTKPPSGDNADAAGGERSAAVRRRARAAKKPEQSTDRFPRHRPDEATPVQHAVTPVSYHGTSGAALMPPGPEEIAESIAEAIREKRADKENGKTLLKQYLHGMGVQFRAQLDPVTGGGAQAVANVAFQLSGIIESTLFNTVQMRRWFDGEEFMDGVNFDFVFQTVQDYQRMYPFDEKLTKAVAMLQEYVRQVPRGEVDEVDYKGRESAAPRTSRANAGNGLKAASAATATNAAAKPAPVTSAEIYEFGKKLVAEVVPDGADRHGVRLGKDIYIPSAVIVPHWHLNEHFVVYKHHDTNHIEVAQGSNVYQDRAQSVGMRLDPSISRDHQLLRVQAFILTGAEA